MAIAQEEQKNPILSEILALANDRLPAAQIDEVGRFIREYYKQVDSDDLAERSAADLYGAALSHLSMARRFVSGAAKIRVFNPRLDEHGWNASIPWLRS